MKIAELDLPSPIIEFYESSGIKELYPPQAEAVKKGFLDGNSLLAAIPTASGKTLLAEMAMLKSIANGGKAIYIVPLKALASEKFERFQEFSEPGDQERRRQGRHRDRAISTRRTSGWATGTSSWPPRRRPIRC